MYFFTYVGSLNVTNMKYYLIRYLLLMLRIATANCTSKLQAKAQRIKRPSFSIAFSATSLLFLTREHDRIV